MILLLNVCRVILRLDLSLGFPALFQANLLLLMISKPRVVYGNKLKAIILNVMGNSWEHRWRYAVGTKAKYIQTDNRYSLSN